MKKEEIKKLALSIADNGGISDSSVKWILDNFSKADIKLFVGYLEQALRDVTVTARYAGEPSDAIKEKIKKLFPDKNIIYSRDDENIIAGIRFEYGDYILDYSVSNMISKIMKSLKESL